MNKLLNLIVLFLLGVQTFSCASQGYPVSTHWIPTFIAGHGTFPVVYPDIQVEGTVHLGSDVAGQFISTNKGNNWTFVNANAYLGLTSAIIQAETNPDIVYAIGDSVVKSVDHGNTWTKVASYTNERVSNGASGKSIAIDRNNSNIVYIGTSSGDIVKTTDGGATWSIYASQPFGGKPVSFLRINKASTFLLAGSVSRSSPTTGYGMISFNLTNSTSTTITLAGVNSTINGEYVNYVDGSSVEHVCVNAGYHIACSADDGVTWTNTNDITMPASNYYVAHFGLRRLLGGSITIVAFYEETTSFYTQNNNVLSTDSGTTWASVNTNITLDLVADPTQGWASFGTLGSTFSIAADPLSQNTWYLTTDGWVFRSDDGGHNWVEAIVGAQNTVVTSLAVSPIGTIFACGMDMGCVASTTNGSSWVATIPNGSNGSPQGFTIAGHYWRVVTTGSVSDWNAGNGHVIITSSPYIGTTFPIFEPVVWRSVDNGVTWAAVTANLPPDELACGGVWGIGYPRGLTVSPDGTTLYMSIDGYNTTGSNCTGSLTADTGGIYKSTDNGATWTKTTQPTSWKVYRAIALDPTDVTWNTVVFGTFFDSTPVTGTYRSTDGGTTWAYTGGNSSMAGGSNMIFNQSGIPFETGLNIINSANPSIYSSSNGGSVWFNMHNFFTGSTEADGVAVDPTDTNRMFVGTVLDPVDPNIFMTVTANSGSSSVWKSLQGDLPAGNGVQAIAINPFEGNKGYLYVATNGAGVFKINLDDTSSIQVSNVHISY